MDGLEDCLGLRVGLAETVIVRELSQLLKEFELTPKQATVLWLVAANEGVSLSDLARFFRIERTTLFPMVNSLVESGLLARHYPSGVGRRTALQITAQGQARLEGAKQRIEEFERLLRAPLNGVEVAFTHRILNDLFVSAQDVPKLYLAERALTDVEAAE